MDFSLFWTVAEAAARYRRSHGRLVPLRLLGQSAYATSDASIIQHIMGPGAKNYLLRPGQPWGLAAIGMLSQGIIWNQDLKSFHQNRECFQSSLSAKQLARGSKLALRVTEKFCSTFGNAWQKERPKHLLTIRRIETIDV